MKRFKRIIGILVITSILAAFCPCIIANAITSQDGANWAIARIGQSIDTDGWYGAQCKDFVNAYCQENWGFTPPGNAIDLKDYNYPAGWQKIKNTPDFVPMAGDIAVWAYGSYSTYGHCGIIISANVNNFVSVDQNWYGANGTTGSPAAQVPHNYSGFWGVIRPTFDDPTPPAEPIHKDNYTHVRNGYFTFKNAASGTFLNVWGGVDRDEQQITTWTFDDSIDQRFNVVHQGDGKYRIYAECSSNGSNRVVDIRRGSNPVTEGQSVELWPPVDDTSQLFYIWPVNNTEFVFEIASKEGYIIAPNASAAGSNSLDSLLKVQRYTGGAHQRWILCNNNGQPTVPFVTYAPGSYKVNTGGTPIRLRTGPGVNSEVITTVPDQTILRVTQVNENWGYTNFNGRDGWVLLDFTEYTVTIDSINVSKMPDKTSYYVGENLDSAGLEIAVNYSNGQKEIVGSGFEISGDLSSPGTKNIIVSYKGQSTSYSVNVNEPEVVSIVLYSNDITKLYYVGDNLIMDEIGLRVNYANGTEGNVVSGFTADYDFSTPGRKTVAINYGGKTTSYEVEVFERPDDGKPLISVGSSNCCAGDVIEVPVSLRANDIFDGNFTIQYDSSKMSVIKTTAQGALANRQTIINDTYDTGKIRVSFAGTTPVSCNGDILKIIFEVNDGAVGSADVTIGDVRMYNIDGGAVDCGISNGAVNIQSPVGSPVVSNVQIMTTGGRKVVTANVAVGNVVCYLASYSDEELVECDMQSPLNGKVVLSVTDNGSPVKLMVWDKNMQPLIQARSLY